MPAWCSPSAACRPARIGKLSHSSRLRFGVAQEHAVHRRGAGRGEAHGRHVGQRDAEPRRRILGRGDDRRDRALRPLLGRRPELLGDVDNFTPVVADRERAGRAADVDAEVVGQRGLLVMKASGTVPIFRVVEAKWDCPPLPDAFHSNGSDRVRSNYRRRGRALTRSGIGDAQDDGRGSRHGSSLRRHPLTPLRLQYRPRQERHLVRHWNLRELICEL